MRSAAAKALVLISVLTTLALGLPDDHLALQPYPGTGMFLMLSDIHFDPYADPAIMEQLGAKPMAACQTPASGAFSKFGSDTNYPLLKSTLDHVVATAAENHIHYDYVIVTGDFLAHNFDTRYRQCVGGGDDAYRKFAGDTISFVDGMIAKALPGVPVFAALGNNDSDRGDYAEPSAAFLQSVGQGLEPRAGRPACGDAGKGLGVLRKGRVSTALPASHRPKLRDHHLEQQSLGGPQHCKPVVKRIPTPAGSSNGLTEVLGRSQARGGSGHLDHARSPRHRRHEILHGRTPVVLDRSLHGKVDRGTN